MILDGLFREDDEQVEAYRQLLEPLLIPSTNFGRSITKPPPPPPFASSSSRSVSRGGSSTRRKSFTESVTTTMLVPELYIVPRDKVAEEKSNPGAVERRPNENVPLVWAQSLYILGRLIYDELLSPGELDPLGRRLLPYQTKHGSEVVVQVVLLAESAELQARLATFGLETQTMEACSPVTISPPSALRDAYMVLGKNEKLNLTGRPKRPMGTLSTSKIYRCQGKLYAFLPHFMDKEEFYLVSDNNYLMSVFEQEIAFVKNHWSFPGRPTMVVMLTSEMLGGVRSPKGGAGGLQRWRYNAGTNSKRNLLNFMMSLRSGYCGQTRVRVGRLTEMINMACIESLGFLNGREPTAAEDWHTVLRGEWHADLHKLHEPMLNSSNENHVASTISAPTHRNVRRRSSADLGGLLVSATSHHGNLTSPYYSEDPVKYEQESFKLKDHVDDHMGMGMPMEQMMGTMSFANGKPPSGNAVGSPNGGKPDQRLQGSPSSVRNNSPSRGLSSNRVPRETLASILTHGKPALTASDSGVTLSRRNSYSFLGGGRRNSNSSLGNNIGEEFKRSYSSSSSLPSKDSPAGGMVGNAKNGSPPLPPRMNSNDATGENGMAGHVAASAEYADPHTHQQHGAPARASSSLNMISSPLSSPSVSSSNSSMADLNVPEEEEEILTLTLNDPTNVTAAIAMLKSSANLFDQIDLLHCKWLVEYGGHLFTLYFSSIAMCRPSLVSGTSS
jgi:hypothetical protein